MRGLLGVTTSISNPTSSNWTSSNLGTVDDPNFAASISMTSTANGDWIVSPSFDLGTGTAFQLEFDIDKSSNAFGPGENFSVVISTDDGVTWSNTNILKTWSSVSNLLESKEEVLLDFAAYS